MIPTRTPTIGRCRRWALFLAIHRPTREGGVASKPLKDKGLRSPLIDSSTHAIHETWSPTSMDPRTTPLNLERPLSAGVMRWRAMVWFFCRILDRPILNKESVINGCIPVHGSHPQSLPCFHTDAAIKGRDPLLPHRFGKASTTCYVI